MKKLNILLFIVFLSIISFSQEKPIVKKSVTDFFTTVENYTEGFNKSNKNDLLKSKIYSDSEVLTLSKEYYKARAEDPTGFHVFEKEKSKEFENQLNKTKSTNELSFPQRMGIIYRIISSKYGRAFTDIITIPWFLNVQVLDIKYGKFNSSVGVLGKTYLVVKIEDVIKGKNFFKEGDTVKINYLSNWLNDTNKKYEKGKNYFVGLREWNCYDGNCTEIALYVFPDKDNGIYPIENGHVIAPENYLGIKDNLPWSEFKNQFIKKYIL